MADNDVIVTTDAVASPLGTPRLHSVADGNCIHELDSGTSRTESFFQLLKRKLDPHDSSALCSG